MTENKEELEIIDAAICKLEEARLRLGKNQIWSVYKCIKDVRDAMYFIQVACAHRSARAAMDWGCAIRLPNGQVEILSR